MENDVIGGLLTDSALFKRIVRSFVEKLVAEYTNASFYRELGEQVTKLLTGKLLEVWVLVSENFTAEQLSKVLKGLVEVLLNSVL